MDYMKDVLDKYFDLAIVDPPYGIGNTTTSAGNKKRKTLHKRIKWNNEIPTEKYFSEIYRISKNQIIWGCNYQIKVLIRYILHVIHAITI